MSVSLCVGEESWNNVDGMEVDLVKFLMYLKILELFLQANPATRLLSYLLLALLNLHWIGSLLVSCDHVQWDVNCVYVLSVLRQLIWCLILKSNQGGWLLLWSVVIGMKRLKALLMRLLRWDHCAFVLTKTIYYKWSTSRDNIL